MIFCLLKVILTFFTGYVLSPFSVQDRLEVVKRFEVTLEHVLKR